MTILAMFIRIASHAITIINPIVDITIMVIGITIMVMVTDITIMVMDDRCLGLNHFRRRTGTSEDEREVVIPFQ
jgi:hypothetical protein